MKEKREFLYEILKARDPRYDGRLFVGVLSTGIYCRTVCNAKLPKAENCVYSGLRRKRRRQGSDLVFNADRSWRLALRL